MQCSAGLQWGFHFPKNFTRTSNRWHHHRGGLVPAAAAAAAQQNCLCRWTGTELPCTPEQHLLLISGKTRGCGRTLRKQRRDAVLETRKNQVGSHVTSSLVISETLEVGFKRCKWIPNRSLKARRHTVHTAESHSQTNSSSSPVLLFCIFWQVHWLHLVFPVWSWFGIETSHLFYWRLCRWRL